MKANYLLILTLYFFAFAKAYTQEIQPQKKKDTTRVSELDEVVLTATRTERQLSSLPLPVTLVSGKTIKQSGSLRIDDILAEQTGLVLATDESGFEGIQIQGIDSDYTLVLIDGVPLVGRRAGNFDLSRLTAGNIKQIEVVKGPSSSLYGSEALAGVINIITKTPKNEKLKGEASYRVGSFTEQDINLSFQQKKGKIRYAIFGNRFSSEGYDLTPETVSQTVNPFENYTFNGRFYYDFSDRLKLFASGRYFDQSQDSGFSFTDTNTNGEQVIITAAGEANEQDWNGHVRLDQEWNDNLTTSYELYYTNYIAESLARDTDTDTIITDTFFDQQLVRPEIRSNYTFENEGTLTAGAGYQYESLDRSFFDEQVSFNSQYVYAQYDFNPIENLNIIVGGRFDNHSEYSNQLSPKVALRYNITDELALKGSVGYGFKAPDFRQLYFNFTNSTVGYTVLGYNAVPNELQTLFEQGQLALGQNISTVEGQANVNEIISQFDDALKAESSVGYNIGFTYHPFNELTLDINAFRNNFSDLIDTQVIARKTNGQNVFSYKNFDRIYTEGLELNATYKITQHIKISGGYQLLYAFNKDIKDQVENGELFVRDEDLTSIPLSEDDHFGFFNRSRHTANLKLFYNIPKWTSNINARVIYRSKYGLGDTNGNGTFDAFDDDAIVVDGFATVNIAASKKLFDHFEIQAGADNLFDFQNTNIPGIPGTRGYVKINYQF
ncbi:TonB-dependent receptor [Dokdonia pacifica]|uniref:Outer membrane receptor for ferrienterochelin and colicins n=1 Tax=Dokdonia pacifica TaxID=1627892 RepID=A0A239CR64_9FLAO|nr:TonB-dependent receptor [Dokdonia pacifica]GGG39190.1 TonB-dependent receptor [Dokdonia pacifica]SNS22419.1 outer membrane receptor for ferrienterochelin and colicins [Dokdonia pacifica]